MQEAGDDKDVSVAVSVSGGKALKIEDFRLEILDFSAFPRVSNLESRISLLPVSSLCLPVSQFSHD